MADDRAREVLRTWDGLFARARRWHPIWRALATYLQPRKSVIDTDPQPGEPLTELLFDSVGVHANELLAASMQGSLTSMTVPFFGLRLRGVALGEDPEVDRWLEACATTMYDELRQSSNFASESHEMYLDLGTFGIGAVFCEPRPPKRGQPYTGLRFTSFAPGSFAIDESADGVVDTVLYRTLLTARAAVDRWSPDAVCPAVRGAATDPARTGELFPFIHAIYPRESAIASGPLTPATKLPWASTWVDQTGAVTVKTSGFHEFPFMVPRWTKASGELYGRGPGFTALPDLKTLNKVVELKLRQMAKVVNPPVKVRDDGVIGTVRLSPGGLTHVRDMDAVQPMDLGGRFDVTKMEEDHLRQAIRRIFFSDQLQLQEGPQMTAYEVQVRYELMQRILGPTLGRLEVEWLNPLIERVFGILRRAGRLPSPSPRVMQILQATGPIDVEYEGPLARAQRLSETVALQRFFQLVLPLAEARPDVMDNLDLDEVVRTHAMNTSVTARILRLPYERDELRQARAQAQQAQSQQEQMAGMADVAGKGAPIIKALLEANQGGVPANTMAVP